jgi:DNA-binding IclR family transcriptional regulator
MKKAKSDYLIQSVSRALDILEAFAVGQESLGVTELSRKLKLHKNNVFRLLATLETRGYVEQDRETGNYRLGIKTFEVASVFLHHLGLVEQARGALEQLASETTEAAYLAVLDGPWVICVDAVETTHPVRVVSWLGQRRPAHATALGKAQLAFRPQDELEQLWKQHDLVSVTPRTIADAGRLGDELARIAAQEAAFEDEEAAAGVRGVAVPVRDYQKRVVAAVGVIGPASRLTLERLQGEIVGRVKAAAHTVGKRLGYAVLPG